MPPDPDEYLDDEPEEGSARSIFAAGWFRAVLFLVALAVALVVSLPYLLERLEPSRQPPRVTQKEPGPQPPTAPPVAVPPPPIPAPTGEAAAPTPPPVRLAPPAAPAPAKPPEKAALQPADGPTKPSRRAEVRLSQKTARAEPAERRVSAVAPAEPQRPASRPAPSGEYWVQVGAFQDRENADRLAKALQGKRFPAEVVGVTRPAPGGPRHELFVTGASVDAVEKALGGSSTAEAVRGGVVVRPTLNLRDAVTLSRRLASEGLVVKIRRVGEDEGADATYHLVRVGGFPDREPAEAARRELSAAGHAGFVTQGPPR